MYFKFSLRYNKDKQCSDAYYRSVGSYRNASIRPVCHRTILNIGFIAEEHTPEQLNQTARVLTTRYEQKQPMSDTTDVKVLLLVETLWQRIVQEKRLDLTLYNPTSRQVDADTLRHRNVYNVEVTLSKDKLSAQIYAGQKMHICMPKSKHHWACTF